jgi:AcrR family transcriptional regulator
MDKTISEGSSEVPESRFEDPVDGEGSSESGAKALEGEADAPGVRPPKQERSRKTLERIVAAALELLQESGVEGTTVSDIVERANTSVGSFYARFKGKDDLLGYLRDRFQDEVLDRWDQGVETVEWAALPLGARVAEAVGLLVEAFRKDWRLSQVLWGVEEEGGWWAREFRKHALGTLVPALVVRPEELAHGNPAQAVEVGYGMAAGAIRDAVEVDRDGAKDDGPGGFASLAPELARAWTAYLESWQPEPAAEAEEEPGLELAAEAEEKATAPVPRPATPTEVDFFDPWG